MTKKKTPVSTPAVTLTTKAMHDAEILDFRMTKEDVIDLMVDQAERDLTAQIAALNKELENVNQKAEKEVREYILRQPQVVTLVKAFGKNFALNENGTHCLLHYPNQSNFNATFNYEVTSSGETYVSGAKRDRDGWKLAAHSTTFMFPVPAMENFHKESKRITDELTLANGQLNDVRRSPRKLKVELTKKILSNTEAGKSLLSNIGQMTKAFQQGLLAPQLPSGE